MKWTANGVTGLLKKDTKRATLSMSTERFNMSIRQNLQIAGSS